MLIVIQDRSRADGDRIANAIELGGIGNYVACEIDASLFTIDTVARKALGSVKIGTAASGVAVPPDGKRVFVSDGKGAAVVVVDPGKNEIVATIPVGQRPWNMAFTPDGKKLYVANGRSQSVSVIDAVALKKLADVPVGVLPWGVAIAR